MWNKPEGTGSYQDAHGVLSRLSVYTSCEQFADASTGFTSILLAATGLASVCPPGS